MSGHSGGRRSSARRARPTSSAASSSPRSSVRSRWRRGTADGDPQGQHALESRDGVRQGSEHAAGEHQAGDPEGHRRAAGGVLRGDHVRGVRAGRRRLADPGAHRPTAIEPAQRSVTRSRNSAATSILYFKCGSVMESKFGKEDDAIRYYDAAIKTSPSCLPAVARPARSLPAHRRLAARDPDARAGSQAVDRGQRARRRVRAHRADLRRQARRSGSRDSSITRARSPSTRSACRRNRALFELLLRARRRSSAAR